MAGRKSNPLFGPQTSIDRRRLKGPDIRYGLEVDVTGRGAWVEQGLYGTKALAEKDGRQIKKREGMDYRVKITRDQRNSSRTARQWQQVGRLALAAQTGGPIGAAGALLVNPLTDRAKRYRAQRNKPPGRKQCNICGNRRNVDIDHIGGNEDEGERENLWYLCRRCNTSKGIVQARNRIGRRTRQFNPAGGVRSLNQYRNCAAVLIGLAPGDVAEATEKIRATSPERRAAYAEENRKNPDPTFEQYAAAVWMHQRGAHDEGGAIIHATPKAKRSKYAGEIARLKKQRGTGRRSEVPF